MTIDIHAKSEEILTKLANSVYDRTGQDFFFTIKEIHIVEKWMRELMSEVKSPSWSNGDNGKEINNDTNSV